MSDSRLHLTAATGLVLGAALGMAGTFVSSTGLRGLAWGVDGTALVVAGALLTVYYARHGDDLAAAGFLVFVVGEALILGSAAMELVESAPVFTAGASLWAASLALVSASGAMPPLVRGVGLVASLLFAVGALQGFAGGLLTPLAQPLPFFAYPFLAATLCGWAWVHYRKAV